MFQLHFKCSSKLWRDAYLRTGSLFLELWRFLQFTIWSQFFVLVEYQVIPQVLLLFFCSPRSRMPDQHMVPAPVTGTDPPSDGQAKKAQQDGQTDSGEEGNKEFSPFFYARSVVDKPCTTCSCCCGFLVLCLIVGTTMHRGRERRGPRPPSGAGSAYAKCVRSRSLTMYF